MSQSSESRLHLFVSRDLRNRFFETPRGNRRESLDRYLAPFILKQLRLKKGTELDELDVRLLVANDGPPVSCSASACGKEFQPVRVAYLKLWKIHPHPKQEQVEKQRAVERMVPEQEVRRLGLGLYPENEWLLPFLDAYPVSRFPTSGVPICNGNFILGPKGEEWAFCGSLWRPVEEPADEFTRYEPNPESHLALALKRIREQGVTEFSYASCTLPVAELLREEKRLQAEEAQQRQAEETRQRQAELQQREEVALRQIDEMLTF